MTSRSITLLPLILLLALTISSCGENGADMEPVNPADEIFTKDLEPERDEDCPRYANYLKMKEGKLPKLNLNLDTANFPIHIRDNYGDYIYLKLAPKISSSYQYYQPYSSYIGHFVSAGTIYNASMVYNSNNKTMAICMHYYDSQVMLYNVHWVSTNFFGGAYTWETANQNFQYKTRRISCTYVKGSLPGMND